MLVYEVASPLLPVDADLTAAFYEAGVRLLVGVSLRCDDWVVVLRYMQVEEVSGGKVLVAVGTAVSVSLLVVRLIFGIGCEAQKLVRWQEATHCGRSLLFRF